MIPLEHVIPQTNDIISFGQELFFSLGIMSTVFVYLGFCLPRIAASHELKSEKFLRQESYYKITFEFIYKMALLALTQMGAIFIWGGAIYIFGLSKSASLSFLFAGSCYTTMGIFSDTLPAGWKSISLIIAFSGLFSFAWCTSIMMSMTKVFQKSWKIQHLK